jgi:hypothetical protein
MASKSILLNIIVRSSPRSRIIQAEEIEQHVRRRIVAQHDHQGSDIPQRQFDSRPQILKYTGAADLLGGENRNPMVEREVAAGHSPDQLH